MYSTMINSSLQFIECCKTVSIRVVFGNISQFVITDCLVSLFLILLRKTWLEKHSIFPSFENISRSILTIAFLAKFLRSSWIILQPQIYFRNKYLDECRWAKEIGRQNLNGTVLLFLKCYVRDSRTKFSRIRLFLMEYIKNYDFHSGKSENSDFF